MLYIKRFHFTVNTCSLQVESKGSTENYPHNVPPWKDGLSRSRLHISILCSLCELKDVVLYASASIHDERT